MINKLKLIFSLLLLLAFAAISGAAQEAKETMRFSVTDAGGNFFGDLKAADIQLRQDKNLLQVISLETRAESALELTIMIDASASQHRMLPFEKELAGLLLSDILKPGKDKVAVVKFTGEVSIEQELTNDFDKAREQINKIEIETPKNLPKRSSGSFPATLENILKTQQPPMPPTTKKNTDPRMIKNATSVWDSIKAVVEDFSKNKSDKNTRRAIILISDGVNTFGEGKLKEAVYAAVKNQIPVYALGVGDYYLDGVDEENLEKLSEQTGGILVMPKDKVEEVQKQLKKIETSLRSSYEVTFAPKPSAAAAAGKDVLQEVKIKIASAGHEKKKLRIIQPKGFAAAAAK